MGDSHNNTDRTLAEAAPSGSGERETASTVAGPGDPAQQANAPAYIPQFQPGDLIDGRFAVIRFIARGGMGEVYEVEDRQLRGVRVALKTILSQYAANPVMRQRFEREVLSAREVVHPNICPTYDLGHWNRPGSELTYLTMKLLPGESLAARISRVGPLPGDEALCILKQVGSGIAAAHDAGILHRDIKAANIILQGSGAQTFAWVTDFGLARAALGEETALTMHGVAGTPGFMAPELFYGGAPTKATDVFSFGVVAYQIITARLPHLSLIRTPDTAVSELTEDLPPRWRQLVNGCLEPNLELRFEDIPSALQSLTQAPIEHKENLPGSRFLTRRKMIALTATGCLGAAGGAWVEREKLIDVFEPLPAKRFVALMAWPVGESTPVVQTILDSIGNRLARAEAYVKDLLVVSARDVPAGGLTLSTPNTSESSLGANLVLAASAEKKSTKIQLRLQLLEAMSQRVLRKSVISCPLAEISGLTEQAVEQAALLLRLPRQELQISDAQELRSLPPDVLQAYSEADQLARNPDHSGLKQSILRYQDALELDPHFALGYAKLAEVYIEQYLVTREPANIDLAEKNASKALRYNPNSAMGLISQALCFLYSGKTSDAFAYFAKALEVDPGNPMVLIAKAEAMLNAGRLADAEQVYHDIISERPNYWQAYNNLGVALSRQARYEEAEKAFAEASMTAPTVALPMANLGATYIQLGKPLEARNMLTESLRRGASKDTYLALGDLDFENKNYDSALNYYQKASELEPNFHLIQRNIGDCYAMLGNLKLEAESYRKAANLISSNLSVNPQNGYDWSNLAFYDAKIGNVAGVKVDIRNAELHGGKDVASRFMIAQALAVQGKKEDSLKILLWCMDNGLSSQDVDLAIDLRDLQRDPRYKARLKDQTDRKASSI